MGLGRELLGKQITMEVLEALQKTAPESELTMIGEGGEFESFVLDAPFFPSRIEIKKSKVHWNEHREDGFYEIIEAKLSPKRKISLKSE